MSEKKDGLSKVDQLREMRERRFAELEEAGRVVEDESPAPAKPAKKAGKKPAK